MGDSSLLHTSIAAGRCAAARSGLDLLRSFRSRPTTADLGSSSMVLASRSSRPRRLPKGTSTVGGVGGETDRFRPELNPPNLDVLGLSDARWRATLAAGRANGSIR
eukprot:CAMPEP_0113723534 /NCGR_PEP_ID=MMETSP0038_2-20120614/38481_1 /TAXON_ID=2898 /ORGANISM="Cryptomonas paramecium" /LENGTH=105 /DNA_ID=CAMNT_0000653143 /DNA_START=134 /DNA_END=451 /DNA_ORIENTATION=+ /assembly_acc=CAM_ASM_000170